MKKKTEIIDGRVYNVLDKAKGMSAALGRAAKKKPAEQFAPGEIREGNFNFSGLPGHSGPNGRNPNRNQWYGQK